MDAATIIQYLSIVLEAAIVIASLILAISKKKVYGWLFALTFAIYVFYDYAKLAGLSVSSLILSVSFFIATISALAAVWMLYKKK